MKDATRNLRVLFFVWSFAHDQLTACMRTSEQANEGTNKRRNSKQKHARTINRATRKSFQNRSRDAPRTPPGRSGKASYRAKFAPKRTWCDLGRSRISLAAARTLQNRLRTHSGRAQDAPGISPGWLGALPEGPGTSLRRLGELSGQVFHATLAKKLADRLAERFLCDFVSLASCRAMALMCTKHQF